MTSERSRVIRDRLSKSDRHEVRSPFVADYPFPFIGAGEANYFEWADVHVYFKRVPKPAERAAIVKGVPTPLADSADWDGKHLYVASEQGVGRVIQAAYANPPKKPSGLTTTSRLKISGLSRTARFNADIERWLQQAHEIVPILAAYRRQDDEAGGTKLSVWHTESVRSVPAIVKAIGKVKPGAPVKSMVAGMKAERMAVARHAAPPDAPTLVDDLMDSLLNATSDRTQLAKAKAKLAAIAAEDSAESWWRAAREIADHVATSRHELHLGHAGFRAIALRVFQGALVRATPRSHAAAFQVLLGDGFPAWHLARIVAIALETAARAGDLETFAHFTKAVVKKRMAEEIERAAAACDEERRPAIARQLRALL